MSAKLWRKGVARKEQITRRQLDITIPPCNSIHEHHDKMLCVEKNRLQGKSRSQVGNPILPFLLAIEYISIMTGLVFVQKTGCKDMADYK
jgi:hypothetical protein